MLLQATPSSFMANKNGSNQTGVASITWTQITFGTEVYDIGANFASSTWTPPAGLVRVGAQFYATGTITNNTLCGIAIYKDGAIFAETSNASSTNVVPITSVVTEDFASGSNAYTAYAYMTLGSGTGTIDGNVGWTLFWGHWISK